MRMWAKSIEKPGAPMHDFHCNPLILPNRNDSRRFDFPERMLEEYLGFYLDDRRHGLFTERQALGVYYVGVVVQRM